MYVKGLFGHLLRSVGAVEKRPKITSFSPKNGHSAWHHGGEHASLSTHLQSFDSPIAVEEDRPSLEMPT